MPNKDYAEFEAVPAFKNFLKKHFKKFVFQVETRSEGNLYIQCFARAAKKQTTGYFRTRLIKLFPGHSIFVSASSTNGLQALAEYAMKEDTRVAGPWGDETVYLHNSLVIEAYAVTSERTYILVSSERINNCLTVLWKH